MMAITSWLIGSYENLPAQSFTVTAGGAEVVTVSAGNYFLTDDTDAVSLTEQTELAIETHTGVAGATVSILENRKVRIVTNVATAITWGSATLLRDILGFTGDLGSATTHTADNVSEYLWSPGRTETPTEAPLGVVGDRHYDTVIGVDAAGTTLIATENTSRRVNAFSWRMVTTARYWDSDGSGGTYQAFWEAVLRHEWQWYLHRNVDEDLSGSSAVTLAEADKLGPYKMRPGRQGMRMGFNRETGFERVDAMHSVDLAAIEVVEFS